MAEEQQPSLVGQEISGCEILQKVAVGGMGAVYKARHKALDRIVCVKILSPALTNDRKAVELFLTEARAIAELEHPNIVQVYNVGREKGYFFIIMSFIEGQTLSQIVKKNKRLPLNLVLDLFEGVLLGLDAAHAKGIIHRDIKPSNILVNVDMQPKIVDFGIAKKIDKDKTSTKTTELAGTAYFIAPEQALGKNIDTRADLYSLGASLYYVLTGQFPYNGKNTIDIIQQHINNPVPNPAELRSDLPAWLSGAVQRLMSKDPNDRFQTAKETYVYFQKMRAEDQLNQGASLNLADNSALKLVKDHEFDTEVIKIEEKPVKQSASSKSLLPSVESVSAVKQDNTASSPANQPISEMMQAEKAKTVGVFTPTPSVAKQKIVENARNLRKFLTNLILKLPVFIGFTFLVAYVCYQFGAICSVHTQPTNTLLTNLWSPFVAAQYAPHQLLFMLAAILVLVLIFVSAAVKEYSYSTLTLFCLAIVAYMAGLFTPTHSFLDTQYMLTHVFTTQYYVCYLLVALLWAISFCFTYNRSLPQGLLAGALVALVVTLSYLAPHLSIAPASYIPTYHALVYISLFFGIVAIYYLLNRQERSSSVLPALFLLVSSALMWGYMVSGVVTTMQRTSNAFIANIQVNKLSPAQENYQLEKELGIDSHRDKFAQLNQATDVSILDNQETTDFLTQQIQKIAPDELPQEQVTLFSNMLSTYYHGGSSKLNVSIWTYAVLLPIEIFNQYAMHNNAYNVLMWLLIIFSIALCANALLWNED